MKPKVLVFSGYGLNCEEETKVAFETAGGSADIIHINAIIDNKKLISKYEVLAFPGGFAYGDDTGSGNAYAQKVKNHLWDAIEKFIEQDHLIIGVCNGCQIVINLGLLPALQMSYGKRQIAMLHNESARYIDRWVDLKNESQSPWLTGIDTLMAPIAHGEGKLYADAKTLSQLKQKKLIALRYVQGEIYNYQHLQVNPTGTLEDIAGITDETGKILGLMPHLERAMFFTQLPHWPLLAEKNKREGKKIPIHGPGLQLFKNAMNYFV